MRIAITGSSGLIGTALVTELSKRGDEVLRVVRTGGSRPRSVLWNPEIPNWPKEAAAGLGAVIHLAGENIAAKRWSAAQKTKIRESRLHGTRSLAQALVGMEQPPRTVILASAIGYYGDRGDELLDEGSPVGAGFLPELCSEWEKAADPLRDKGVRTVPLRFGVVLSKKGGALQRMLLPFKMGVGGRLGSGRQWMSWISLVDVVHIIEHVLRQEDLAGPVNVVAPSAVTNLEFTKALGAVLKRPTIFPMPALLARAAFGELADALLLSSAKVSPKRLLESGYKFQTPDILSGLQSALV